MVTINEKRVNRGTVTIGALWQLIDRVWPEIERDASAHAVHLRENTHGHKD